MDKSQYSVLWIQAIMVVISYYCMHPIAPVLWALVFGYYYGQFKMVKEWRKKSLPVKT